MPSILSKKSPITIGLAVMFGGILWAGSLYVNNEVDAACDTLRKERLVQYGGLKEDLNEVKNQIHEVQVKQTADNEKILLLLLDIKNGD